MGRTLRRISGSGALFALLLALLGVIAVDAPAGAVVAPTSISPTSGAPGTNVTVSGAGFSGTSLTGTVNGESVSVKVVSTTSVTLVVPNDAPAGAVTIVLANGGVALSPTFSFTVFQFTANLLDPEVGVGYSQKITVAGGKAPYTWTIASGSVPSGLTFSAGVFSGTAKVAGPFTITIQAIDANGASAQLSYTINVDPGPTITIGALPVATVNTNYLATIPVTGGVAPYQWSINSGPIPAGLVLSSTGIISGKPGALGISSISIRVTDANGSITSKSVTLAVRPSPQSATLITASGATESVSTFGTPIIGLEPIPAVAVATSADGTKTWIASSTGSVVALFGGVLYGSVSRAPRHPIVAMAARPDGSGYWLVTANGHVYAFGAARNFGSVKGKVAGRVVGIASTPSGGGYLIVTSKGHLYRFGNAPRVDSPRPGRLRGEAVGAVVTKDGHGVFVASTSGVVLGFGSARTERIKTPLASGVVATIIAPPGVEGYWLVTATGAIVQAGVAEVLPTLPVPPGVVSGAAAGV